VLINLSFLALEDTFIIDFKWLILYYAIITDTRYCKLTTKSDQRKPFVFSLYENYVTQLHHGLLAYNIEIGTLRLKPIFFMGISRSRLITGPFQITGEPTTTLSGPKRIGRLEEVDIEHGVFKLRIQEMPWLVPFKAIGKSTDMGLKWDYIAKKLGINPQGFKNLISVKLSANQIDWLNNKLLEINT